MIRSRSILLICCLVITAGSPTIALAQEVKIGLLIPDPESLAARHGAELAVRKANEARSNGRFQLIVRSTEGPWGAGSKESVSMVFEDEVAAILGSLDGRNAHLAEQVAAKTRVAFLSAWATEMTLSGAFVPWYFRCIPNDRQQAAALAREIYDKKKIRKVATIASDTYDARHAARSFSETAVSRQMETPRPFFCGTGREIKNALDSIKRLGIEAIVLFGDPQLAAGTIPLMKQQGMNQMIFGTLAVADGQKASGPDWNILEGMVLVSSSHWFTEEGRAFQKEFYEAFGYQPGAAAAYAYDGMNVLIGVIGKAGADRDRIIEVLPRVHHRYGVTGSIQFDASGNRVGDPALMTIMQGNPGLTAMD